MKLMDWIDRQPARIGFGQRGGTPASPANFGSRLDVVATAIPDPGLTHLRTAGFGTPGDGGGAVYVRTGAEPAHDGKIQSADGTWWDLVPEPNGVNAKVFGARGDGSTDDTAALQSAITYSAAAGHTLILPDGDYRTTAALLVPANAWIVGQSRNGSVINGITKSFAILDIQGSSVRISDIYVRDGSVGIRHTSGVANRAVIQNCRISYNRIGIEMDKAYITLVHDNEITFNSWGIITGNQSFQVVIRDNVVDNNLGGGGIISFQSSGTVITGNTIEGNRVVDEALASLTGFGLWIVGANQRTIIRDNWFEQNGAESGASDIIVGRPNETWVDDLVTDCFPGEYASHVAHPATINGQINIDGNFFYATQRGVTVNLPTSNYGTVSISNGTFVGIKNKNNMPVQLYGSGNARIRIDDNNVTNTVDITIDAEMLAGVKQSYVFHEGTVPARGIVELDGEDLFTAHLTTLQFAALAGATLDARSRAPSSNEAILKNGAVVARGGTEGARIGADTGRARAGAAAWFPTLDEQRHVVVLASGSGAGFTYQASGGFAFKFALDGDGYFSIHTVTPVTTSEATLGTGDYFGWAIMTDAQIAASVLSGCARLMITDLDVTEKPMTASTIPSAWTGAVNYKWMIGDVVYNDAAAAGGTIGWVCTATGNPGTWKSFGTIAD